MSKLADRVASLEQKVDAVLNTRAAAQAVAEFPIGKVVSVTGVVDVGHWHLSPTDEITVTGTLHSATRDRDELCVNIGGLTVLKARFA